MSEANVEGHPPPLRDPPRQGPQAPHGRQGRLEPGAPAAVDRARTEMRSLHVSHHRRIVARTGQADPPIDRQMTAITLIGNYVDRHIALESQVRTALDRARPPCGTRFVPQLSPALKLRLPGKEGVEQRLVL
jgi:hypothetical protein